MAAVGEGTPYRLLGTIVDVLKAAAVRQVAVEDESRRMALPFKAMVWQVNAGTFTTALSPTDLERQPVAAWPEGKAVVLAPVQ